MLLIIELGIIILFCLCYQKKHNWEFASPFFLLCISFTISLLIVLFNYLNWSVNISFKFVIYLSTAIFSIFIGDCIAEKIINKQGSQIIKNTCLNNKIIGKRIYLLIGISFALSIVFAIKNWEIVPKEASLSFGLRLIYVNVVKNNYSPGFLANQFREVVVAVTYISFFFFLNRWICEKKYIISDFIFSIISFCALLLIIMYSTDRNIFIRFIVYILVLFILLYEKKYSSFQKKKELILYVLLFGFISIFIFYILGKTKNYKSGIFKSLSIYGGSGLNNLNIWLNNYDGRHTHGYSTFSTLINSLVTIFNKFNISINYFKTSRFDSFINYTSTNGYYYSSNIYSALMPYIKDFGYFGIVIIPLITGVFYGLLYRYTKKYNTNLSLILYSMLIYPVIFYPILEQLFNRFHLGLVYELVWIIFIYHLSYRCNIKTSTQNKI